MDEKEKECEECDGHGWVHGDAGGGNVRRVECEICEGRGQVPADEAVEERGTRMRPIIRALVAVFLCLGFLAVIAFLIVVDIIDDISRDQDRWETTNAVIQDLPSPKPSKAD